MTSVLDIPFAYLISLIHLNDSNVVLLSVYVFRILLVKYYKLVHTTKHICCKDCLRARFDWRAFDRILQSVDELNTYLGR